VADAHVPRVLILLHSAKDARLTAEVVASEGAAAITCQSLGEVGREIGLGADALILSEDVLEEDSATDLGQALAAQPGWSSVPVLLMVADGYTSPLANAVLEQVASVQILTYPVGLATFRSAIRSALVGRRRQYQVRDLLVDLARREEALRASEERYRSLAEENERLYRRQLQVAEDLQSSLLHIPSEIGLLRLGHLYRSATEAARVGGDFYDAFEMRGGKVAVLIGDVSGHGIEAARTATLVKDVIHAFGHQTHKPELILGHTNRLLLAKNLPGFVTLFLGILNTDADALHYCSAGHPPMLLRRSSGEVESLALGPYPLGVFTEASWKLHETNFRTGDLLFLYTDGITEARQDGQFFGEERLRALVEQTSVGAAELPPLVLDEVLAFSSGSLHDDQAILTLSLAETA
jgi:serine phosphatase RsbU (regulator of sigma subunit)